LGLVLAAPSQGQRETPHSIGREQRKVGEVVDLNVTVAVPWTDPGLTTKVSAAVSRWQWPRPSRWARVIGGHTEGVELRGDGMEERSSPGGVKA